MNFITGMFSRMAASRVRATKMKVQSKVRRKTVGRVQDKMMKGMANADRKVNAGMDGKGVKPGGKKEKGPGKMKAPKGPKMKGGGGGGDEDFDEVMDDFEEPVHTGAPRPVAARTQDKQDYYESEKTVSIDLNELTGGKERPEIVGWIVAMTGSDKGDDFRMYDGKNILGTAADCQVVVTDPYLSAKHCTIRHDSGNFVLIDLDSTNGTFVNQKRVTKMDLIDNDTIRIGRTEFKFKSLF